MDLTKYKLIDITYPRDTMGYTLGEFILDLNLGSCDRSEKSWNTIRCVKLDARDNFGAEYIGDRIFFRSNDDREKFIVYMTLKWS